MAVDTPPTGFDAYADEPLPGVAAGAPGKDGCLELTFAPDDSGTTRLVREFARAPFHISGTLATDPHPDAATVMVQSPTGGVGQGDRRETTLTARAGSVARVTTGSATKVQSMTANYAADTERLVVESGAHLEYVPRPTILHADARYTRDISLTVAADASAVIADIVVPGRLARGERFAFERYRSQVAAHEADDGPLFRDGTDIAPGAEERVGGDPLAPGALDGQPVWGSLFVVAPAVESQPLSDRLHEAATAAASETEQAGATALPNGAGVLVRALGGDADPVASVLRTAWDSGRQNLLDAPAPEGWG
jgi:urease accessory protein